MADNARSKDSNASKAFGRSKSEQGMKHRLSEHLQCKRNIQQKHLQRLLLCAPLVVCTCRTLMHWLMRLLYLAVGHFRLTADIWQEVSSHESVACKLQLCEVDKRNLREHNVWSSLRPES